MENIFFKRNQIFKTEVLAIVVLSGMILLVQLISFLGMRMVFPKKGQYLLFFYNGNIKVITQNMEMVHMLLSSLNITLRRSRLSGVARATLPDKQSHLVTNYCTLF